MKLDLIVPHYKEPWETCKYLFDSIAMQRGIDFANIRVIVVNDGDAVVLDKNVFDSYPYEVEYIVKDHEGVSAARNYGITHSDADYIMFCDADDGFLNNYALHLLFTAMEEGFDLLISRFVEESISSEGKKVILPHNNQDVTFVHGKVYRRAFLIEHEVFFDPDMTLHEDGYFNILAFAVAKREGEVKFVESPLYIWCWNEKSVVRTNKEDFVLRTYADVMKARIGICRELKRRGYDEEYKMSVGMTVLNSYYDFQKPRYWLPQNDKHRRNAEKEFKKFFGLFKRDFYELTNMEVSDIAKSARETALKNGMLMERQDLKSWLKHIEYEVK